MEILARLNINSSVIDAFVYIPDESCLYVKFKNGGEYYYKGVPINIAQKTMNHASAGKGYNLFIRGRYEWTKKE